MAKKGRKSTPTQQPKKDDRKIVIEGRVKVRHGPRVNMPKAGAHTPKSQKQRGGRAAEKAKLKKGAEE